MSKASRPSSPSVGPSSTQPSTTNIVRCNTKRVIVIDPGHGGSADVSGSSHNNATSSTGTLEKDLTLQFANSLKSALDSPAVRQLLSTRGFCDVETLLTRTTDINITSSARVAVATTNLADILLSIHFNGFNGSVRGTETYYKAASNTAQSNESEDIQLAEIVNNAVFGAIQSLDSGAKNRGTKPDTASTHTSLGVLRDPGIGHSGQMCRSALLEVEFIDNPTVDTLLVGGSSASANRDTVMLALAEALANAL